MVSVQMLAELEEVIQYKILPERRAPIRKMWWQRLQVISTLKQLIATLFHLISIYLFQGCQRIVEDWQKIIQVHSLVISPEEDMRTWLKYSSLCRKSGRLVSFYCSKGLSAQGRVFLIDLNYIFRIGTLSQDSRHFVGN